MNAITYGSKNEKNTTKTTIQVDHRKFPHNLLSHGIFQHRDVIIDPDRDHVRRETIFHLKSSGRPCRPTART